MTADLCPLGHAFILEAGHPSPFRPSKFFPVWEKAVRDNMGAFYVAHDDAGTPAGVLGAFFSPELFSGDLQAQEAFWFVAPEFRKTRAALLLLNAFEAEAKARNCKQILMVHLELPNAAGLAQLYARRGYSRCEQFFRKNL
jgi:GNAT superfamily N-acetyltransferase